MNSFIAFTKKEFIEYIRTFKALILIAVLLVFGIISPVIAKLMPDIISGMSIKGMSISLSKPTSLDAYAQFFKNMCQMGIIVMLLVFSGTLSQELSKGTLITMLSKGLSRATVILSKFTAALIFWTIAYVISAATTYVYTLYLFNTGTMPNLLFSLFCLWLFGCFILSVIFVSSTLIDGNYGGLILTAITLGLMLIINMLPKINKFNPITLASDNLNLLNGTVKEHYLLSTIGITSSLTIIFLAVSIILFNKKRL